MNTFAKAHDELIELGLPARLVVLYGVIEHMAGAKGECWPTHATLAKKCGGKSDRQIRRDLHDLQRYKLIDWKRRRYYNRYRPLNPDRQWIAELLRNPDRTKMSGQTGQKCPISDRTKMSDRKEPVLTKPLNQATASQPASQPTSGSVGANAEVDRLAGIKADIIQNWPHLLGSPGPKLIEDCAAMVADEARGEYRALLASRRPKARGFGLALHLARELRDRRNGDATRREQRADAKRDRQRADTAEQIRTLESLRDDPKTPAKDRAEIEAMLNDLHKPKSETGKRARGAA